MISERWAEIISGIVIYGSLLVGMILVLIYSLMFSIGILEYLNLDLNSGWGLIIGIVVLASLIIYFYVYFKIMEFIFRV